MNAPVHPRFEAKAIWKSAREQSRVTFTAVHDALHRCEALLHEIEGRELSDRNGTVVELSSRRDAE
jgi:hypothetical protein